MSMNIRQQPLTEREQLVLRLRTEEKLSFGKIATRVGLSPNRARQIYREAKARWDDYVLNREDSLWLLPTLVRKLVRNLELGSRAQIRAAIESGELWRDEKCGKLCRDHQRLRHAGVESWVLLHDWAGLPRPPVARRIMTCPHCGKEIEL